MIGIRTTVLSVMYFFICLTFKMSATTAGAPPAPQEALELLAYL